MAEPSRLEALRRRVHDDPASVAFAALAEEYRRAGRAAEAITTCRAGLAHHPGYVSARVTLGRALADTGALEEAREELDLVLQVAPENLAALKAVAELHRRSGELDRARARYRDALLFAPHDVEVHEVLAALEPPVAQPAPSEPGDPPLAGLALPEPVGEGLAAPLEAGEPQLAGQWGHEPLPEAAPRVAPPLRLVLASPQEATASVEVLPPPSDDDVDRVVGALEALLDGVERARARRCGR